MPEKQQLITLYRIENPTIAADPDGITSHEDLVGQWFTPNLSTAMSYLRKSTQTFGKGGHPVAAQMDVENDNYILPLDGTVPMRTIPLDPVIGDLRGQLGRFDRYQEAGVRIRELLGHVAVEK